MALFTDRRTQTVHDIGMNAMDHDPAAGLAGWASAHADARAGLAAVVHPSPLRAAYNVLPGMIGTPRVPRGPASPTAFTPNITSPAEQRAAAARSRSTAWSNGSTATTQNVLPSMPMQVSSMPSQTVLPASRRPLAGARGWAAMPMKVGASFAQKTRRR